jgi:tRNA pseudouridine13 synthase
MKLKRLPADFQVEEQISLDARGGPFALYRLTKESLGTPEAIDAILAHWNLPRGQVAYAGLKDKHAHTTQFVTIRGGPRHNLSESHLELVHVGWTSRPIEARDIVANRFAIVLRDLTAEALARATAALEEIAASGLANYFDEQRFGSLGESGEFIARPWCLADYERALWLALAEPNVHDRPADREQKKLLRDNWGDWPRTKALLARSHRRSIITYLADKPGDFRRAISLVRQDLRSIWLAAFQSHVWNQILAELLRVVCRPEQLASESIGGRDLPFFRQLDPAQHAELSSLRLPLPSARLHMEGSPFEALYQRVLAAEGLELRQMRLKYPRDTFFSKGERPAIMQPAELASESEADDLYPRRQKLTIRFTLPRGTYATILVKRVTGLTVPEETVADEEPETAPASE